LVAAAILLAMVAVAAIGWLSMLEAALAASAAMLVTRSLRPETARAAVDWTVIVTIGGAFALGAAMSSSGLVTAVAEPQLLAAGASTTGVLLAVYLTTAAFSVVITNNAATVLALPTALEVASALRASTVPFAVTVMMAASASFATPIGYQTNLMVYGPGGYHIGDFVRIGVPITIVTATVALFVIHRVWPP
jgi:di/tricarboxylate transporter